MAEQKRPVLWSCDEYADRITHEDMDEAILDYLDQLEGPFPDTITAYGYIHMEPRLDPDRFLEDALVELDEELSDPDGDPTKPTELMRKAADVFCAVIEAEYVAWACERVETRKIDVRCWCASNRPNWIGPVADREEA